MTKTYPQFNEFIYLQFFCNYAEKNYLAYVISREIYMFMTTCVRGVESNFFPISSWIRVLFLFNIYSVLKTI